MDNPIDDGRKRALSVLAEAPAHELARLWAEISPKPHYARLRGPEAGLIMVRGRAGGGGQAFNLGEASVARASIRLESGEMGHGYCLGRDLVKAETIAVLDAMRQREPAAIDEAVIAPLAAGLAAADTVRRSEAEATRVDFFTLVRGDD